LEFRSNQLKFWIYDLVEVPNRPVEVLDFSTRLKCRIDAVEVLRLLVEEVVSLLHQLSLPSLGCQKTAMTGVQFMY
jgi:hypothetical protein